MLRLCFSLVAASLLFCGCAPTGNKYYPVGNSTPRISSLGFYILPPPGGDWYEKHLDNSLYYFKRTRGTSYALTTKATELIFSKSDNHRQQMLTYFQAQEHLLDSQKRFRNRSSSCRFITLAASSCLQYQFRYDDYGNEKKGPHPYVEVFKKGMICRHPQTSGVGIDLNYKEQSFPQMESASYRYEGEQFISNLNFFVPPAY